MRLLYRRCQCASTLVIPPFLLPASTGSRSLSVLCSPKDEELNFLKDQAEAIKGQLEDIESRMHDLEADKE